MKARAAAAGIAMDDRRPAAGGWLEIIASPGRGAGWRGISPEEG